MSRCGENVIIGKPETSNACENCNNEANFDIVAFFIMSEVSLLCTVLKQIILYESFKRF